MPKCKITVLKREFYQDLVDEYLKPGMMKPCSEFTEGQEFIVESLTECPQNFCGWAWNDIYTYFATLMLREGENRRTKDGRHISIAGCSDGYRPVIFKLERLDD